MRDALNSDGSISDWEPNLCFSSTLRLNFLFPKFVREIVSFKCFDWNWVVWGRKPDSILFQTEVAATGSGLIQASFLSVPLPSWGETPLGKGKGHRVTWPGPWCSGGSVFTASGSAGLDTVLQEIHKPADRCPSLFCNFFQSDSSCHPYTSTYPEALYYWVPGGYLWRSTSVREGLEVLQQITPSLKHKAEPRPFQSWKILSSNNAVDWLLFD